MFVSDVYFSILPIHTEKKDRTIQTMYRYMNPYIPLPLLKEIQS